MTTEWGKVRLVAEAPSAGGEGKQGGICAHEQRGGVTTAKKPTLRPS